MKTDLPNPIPLADIEAARERIAALAIRTPLIRLHVDAPCELWLKLECLQPIGSFKIRGAANAILQADPARLQQGVWTASAGNMAQGVAWCARALGIPCTVVVPDHAPAAKTDAVERMGGRIVRLPFNEWWQVIVDHHLDGMPGLFVHPVSDAAVMAGNGTVGLEILEDLPEVDVVVVPWGGGGLACGLASAIKAHQPRVRVLGAEVETAAPLRASLEAGTAQTVNYTPSFVDGIGGRSMLAEMWPLARDLLDGAVVSSVASIANAVRILATRARVVAEGAGAAAVAAALDGQAGTGRVVAIVSGGNLDPAKLVTALQGNTP